MFRTWVLGVGICLALHAKAQENVQLMGDVRDARSGKPVYCTVELHDPEGRLLSMTNVNSEGHYAMFVPSDASFLLVVTEENGYQDLEKAIGPKGRGGPTFVLDLELHPREP